MGQIRKGESIILRVITAYRPTKNTKGGWSNKAYLQHFRYLGKQTWVGSQGRYLWKACKIK